MKPKPDTRRAIPGCLHRFEREADLGENPLALLTQSDAVRIERFAEAGRTSVSAVAAALIESGLRALRLTRRGIDGASATEIAGRAVQAARRT